jgi:hypothetical protein
MDPLVSLEGANGGHMDVEVKCGIHVATTNGLSANDMFFIGNGVKALQLREPESVLFDIQSLSR